MQVTPGPVAACGRPEGEGALTYGPHTSGLWSQCWTCSLGPQVGMVFTLLWEALSREVNAQMETHSHKLRAVAFWGPRK